MRQNKSRNKVSKRKKTKKKRQIHRSSDQMAPLFTISRSPYLAAGHQTFQQRRLWRQYIVKLRVGGGTRRKNATFWSTFSKKSSKTQFFP